MKKSVFQTIAITVALLLSATCLLYLCLVFFSPVTLANFWNDMGNYSISVRYYGIQYEKTDNIEDLSAYCVKLDGKKDAEKTAEILSKMTNREDFEEFCAKQDALGGYAFSARDYYYGKCTVATYYAKGIGEAVKIAERGVEQKYSDHSPFYILMAEAEELTKDDANVIEAKIGVIILTGGLSVKELVYANEDIATARNIGR